MEILLKAQDGADITDQIQDALSIIEQNSGGVVRLPMGSFIVSRALKVPSYCTITGVSSDDTSLLMGDSLSGSAMIQTNAESNDVLLRDFSIDVNDHPTAGGILLGADSTKQTIISIEYKGNSDNSSHQNVGDFSTGIAIRSAGAVDGVRIIDSIFSHAITAIRFDKDGTRDVSIVGNNIADYSLRAIFILSKGEDGISDVVITNNYIGPPTYGRVKQPIAMQGIEGNKVKGVVFVDNFIDGVDEPHLHFAKQSNKGTADQFGGRGIENFLIAGNDLINGGESGIVLGFGSNFGAIHNNRLVKNDAVAIYIHGWNGNALPGSGGMERPSEIITGYNLIHNAGVDRDQALPDWARTGIVATHTSEISLVGNEVRVVHDRSMSEGAGILVGGPPQFISDIVNSHITIHKNSVFYQKTPGEYYLETNGIQFEMKYFLENENKISNGQNLELSRVNDEFKDIVRIGGNKSDTLIIKTDEIAKIGLGAGDDVVIVHGGNSTVFGDSGDDTVLLYGDAVFFIGGVGRDTIDLRDWSRGATVSSEKYAWIGDAGTIDARLIGVEAYALTKYADVVIGDDTGDTIFGRGGSDHIYGMGGDDHIIGGSGADEIDGGAGRDMISFSDAAAGVQVSLQKGTGENGEASGDAYISIENILGSAHSDVLEGDSGSNLIRGQAGRDVIVGAEDNDVVFGGLNDDLLFGGDGHDVLWGGQGSDTLDGGVGSDWVRYGASLVSVNVNLGTGAGKSGDAEGDVLSGLEHVSGSDHGDVLTGDGATDNRILGMGGDDILSGMGGHDFLLGHAGADQIFGGSGRDILRGGVGGDTLDGGTEDDWVQYQDSAEGVALDLTLGIGTLGDAAGDVFTSIENIRASEFADAITGNTVRNIILGGGGDDTIYGIGGSNVLYGQAGGDILAGGNGRDILYGGPGSDDLDGGAGNDWARYTASSTGVTVSLLIGAGTNGDAEGDVLVGIELLWGSDYADNLQGDDGANMLRGGEGDDVLRGCKGNDVLEGHGGADTFAFAKGDGIDRIHGFEIGTDTIQIIDSMISYEQLSISEFKGDAAVAYDTGDVIVLTGIISTEVSADLFVFG